MRSIIIYYSYSGNTRKVALVLNEYLRQKGEVDLIELKARDESDKFLVQVVRGLRKKRATLEPVNFDLAQYDLICFGTPVWASAPAPAMNTYLDQCCGIENKEIILFTTYGSGMGNERCLNYMQESLVKKGAKNFKKFSIQQFKAKEQNFVRAQIKEALSI